MTVLYRITSIPSSNPPPILKDDKDTLSMQCLATFKVTFGRISAKAPIKVAKHRMFSASLLSWNMGGGLEDGRLVIL